MLDEHSIVEYILSMFLESQYKEECECSNKQEAGAWGSLAVCKSLHVFRCHWGRCGLTSGEQRCWLSQPS